jgi:Rieske Fe-S protein
VVTPSDGETAGVPCWVRNIDGAHFQVFAINCAHLGCPVRWFPQSNLFLCPCHGGAYYADGSRAAGPPERGMFQYRYKVDGGHLFIEAGDMPTPGAPGALARLSVRRSPWA